MFNHKVLSKIILLFLITFTSYADRWRLDANEVHRFQFGFYQCEAHSNPTKAVQIPKPKIVCKSKDKSFEAQLGASIFKVSDDGKYLLGISNSGLHEHAFWVIDSNGKLLWHKKHLNPSSGLSEKPSSFYCSMSITVTREWYAETDLAVIFEINDNKLVDVKVRACRGNMISLRSHSS